MEGCHKVTAARQALKPLSPPQPQLCKLCPSPQKTTTTTTTTKKMHRNHIHSTPHRIHPPYHPQHTTTYQTAYKHSLISSPALDAKNIPAPAGISQEIGRENKVQRWPITAQKHSNQTAITPLHKFPLEIKILSASKSTNTHHIQLCKPAKWL